MIWIDRFTFRTGMSDLFGVCSASLSLVFSYSFSFLLHIVFRFQYGTSSQQPLFNCCFCSCSLSLWRGESLSFISFIFLSCFFFQNEDDDSDSDAVTRPNESNSTNTILPSLLPSDCEVEYRQRNDNKSVLCCMCLGLEAPPSTRRCRTSTEAWNFWNGAFTSSKKQKEFQAHQDWRINPLFNAATHNLVGVFERFEMLFFSNSSCSNLIAYC